MLSFKRMTENLQAKRAEKAGLKDLERIFGESLERLRQIFASGPSQLIDQPVPPYPGGRFLGEIGINAYSQTHHVEAEQFPTFLNIVRHERRPVGRFSYQREVNGCPLSTILSLESRFGGRVVRMLSNDVELMSNIAAGQFNPPPPWIAWYELGPILHVSQGDAHYWLNYIWDPYWGSLSLDAQDAYLAHKRLETIAYISDEDWGDWVDSIRRRDRRTRETA